MIYFSLILTLLFIPVITHAVPPPEFIVQITSQIVPIFGWIFAFLVTSFTVSFQFIRRLISHKYIVIIVSILGIFGVSFGVAYGIDLYLQKKQLEEVAAQISAQQEAYAEKIEEKEKLEEIQDTAAATFIRTYYEYIAVGDLNGAYSMTPKNTSYEEFVSRYTSVTNVRVEKVEKMDSYNYSVRVVLIEGSVETAYGIVTTLTLDQNGNPLTLDSTDSIELGNGTTPIDTIANHEITNEVFSHIIQTTSTVFVLDAREKIEYEYGHYPSSTHIKFADLDEGGEWVKLPKDVPVYVFCWSGIRGSMVVTFLRSKGIDAYYLKDGAQGWVESGGIWEGEVSFSAVYEAERYSKLFTTEQVIDLKKEGVVLIDSREPSTAKQKPLAGSIPLRIMYTPTREMDSILSVVPPESQVVVVCDNYVDCFDARLVGIELERRGHTFLGRTFYDGTQSL
jgi:rhodanese-related sulfurtransferase